MTRIIWKTKKERRLQIWEGKALHGQYLTQAKEVRGGQSLSWLWNGYLKREIESLILAHRMKVEQ